MTFMCSSAIRNDLGEAVDLRVEMRFKRNLYVSYFRDTGSKMVVSGLLLPKVRESHQRDFLVP
jgi:hypothetical protein